MSASTSAGWWKAPTRFLPCRRVDAGLAADAGIDLREEAGRDLHEGHAAAGDRGGKAGEVADDAAAKRHHGVAPLQLGADEAHRPRPRASGSSWRLRPAARRPARPRSPPRPARRRSAGRCDLRDVLVGDDGDPPRGKDRSDVPACRSDQAGADQDVVGAVPEFDADALGRSIGLARLASRWRPRARMISVDDDLVRAVTRGDGDVGERIDRLAFARAGRAARASGSLAFEERAVALLARPAPGARAHPPSARS